MKNFLFFSFFLFCLSLASNTALKAQEEAFRLMVFGDSLSAGYRLQPQEAFYALLEESLHKKGYNNVEVINASISGNTTAQGLARVDKAIAQKPHAVLLELGINDVLQGLDLKQTENNLEQIIQRFQKNNIPVMLIGMQAPPMSSVELRTQFTQLYKDLAKKYRLTFYPFFMDGVFVEHFGVLDMKYLQDDAAHPTAQGVQIMTQKIMPTVERFLITLED